LNFERFKLCQRILFFKSAYSLFCLLLVIIYYLLKMQSFTRAVPKHLLTSFNKGDAVLHKDATSCFIQTTDSGSAGCPTPNVQLQNYGCVLRIADGGRALIATLKKLSMAGSVFVLRLAEDSDARSLPLSSPLTSPRSEVRERVAVTWSVEARALGLAENAILSNGDGMIVVDKLGAVLRWCMFTLPQVRFCAIALHRIRATRCVLCFVL
jgi:hypothetical protein